MTKQLTYAHIDCIYEIINSAAGVYREIIPADCCHQPYTPKNELRRELAGTWADATWAMEFYEKQGFKLMPDKDRLLKTHWKIPQRQIDTSVVLGVEL